MSHTRLSILVTVGVLCSALANGQQSTGAQGDRWTASVVKRVPVRRSSSLAKGMQGKQQSEIYFDSVTNMVTLKFQVQDPNGDFIPSIRPNNFVVYENGIRQTLDQVAIEHAPATVAQLLEYGGRTPGLGRLVGPEITQAGREIIDVLTDQDRVGIWRYSDKVEKLSNFSAKRDAFDALLLISGEPPLSETNLYDAVSYMVPQMAGVQGRKAILLISSGV